jgi:hypothetical protein
MPSLTQGGSSKHNWVDRQNPMHQIWMGYYGEEGNKLYHANRDKITLFKQATWWWCTRATMTYQFMQNDTSSQHMEGAPISVILLPTKSVNKLQEGQPLVLLQTESISFWDYIAKWGGTWMWEGINATQQTMEDTT